MKFLCSTCSHWFKKCALWEYEAQKKGKFTFIIRRNGGWVSEIFSLELFKFEKYFLYDLENEEEKGFLAILDLEAVNVTSV